MRKNKDVPYFQIEVKEELPVNYPSPIRKTVIETENFYGRSAVKTAVEMIERSQNGEKHHILVKASYLLGGYVAGGMIGEHEAIEVLKDAISRKENILSIKDAFKTIERCIKKGICEPIRLDELERQRKEYLMMRGEIGHNVPLSDKQKNNIQKTPSSLQAFPKEIYSHLPEYLQKCCNVFKTDIDKDLLLMGSIGVLSGCFPNINGIYDNKTVFGNLYTYIVAPASAGKGNLVWARMLGKAIHKYKKENWEKKQASYQIAIDEYNTIRKNSKEGISIEKPVSPPMQLLFIPANNSATGVIETIAGNPEGGIMFCTEADTLTGTLTQDWGNFSDLLRSSFHHEPHSFNRRTNKEYVEVEKPRLSIVLSSTMGQLNNLIEDAENGLFSRFCFYQFNIRPKMKNVFERSQINFEDHFNELSEKLLTLYKILEGMNCPVEFELTEQQQDKFNEVFTTWHEEFYAFIGEESIATIRRLGLVSFRISMLFTALRIFETGEFPKKLICSDKDFETSLKIIEVLKSHALDIFIKFPKGKDTYKGFTQDQINYYNSLPATFNRKTADQIAEKLGINLNTCEAWLEKYRLKDLLTRPRHGCYEKKLKSEVSEMSDLPEIPDLEKESHTEKETISDVSDESGKSDLSDFEINSSQLSELKDETVKPERSETSDLPEIPDLGKESYTEEETISDVSDESGKSDLSDFDINSSQLSEVKEESVKSGRSETSDLPEIPDLKKESYTEEETISGISDESGKSDLSDFVVNSSQLSAIRIRRRSRKTGKIGNVGFTGNTGFGKREPHRKETISGKSDLFDFDINSSQLSGLKDETVKSEVSETSDLPEIPDLKKESQKKEILFSDISDDSGIDDLFDFEINGPRRSEVKEENQKPEVSETSDLPEIPDLKKESHAEEETIFGKSSLSDLLFLEIKHFQISGLNEEKVKPERSKMLETPDLKKESHTKKETISDVSGKSDLSDFVNTGNSYASNSQINNIFQSIDLLSLAFICFGEFTSREQSKIVAGIQNHTSSSYEKAELIFRRMIYEGYLLKLKGTDTHYAINPDRFLDG